MNEQHVEWREDVSNHNSFFLVFFLLALVFLLALYSSSFVCSLLLASLFATVTTYLFFVSGAAGHRLLFDPVPERTTLRRALWPLSLLPYPSPSSTLATAASLDVGGHRSSHSPSSSLSPSLVSPSRALPAASPSSFLHARQISSSTMLDYERMNSLALGGAAAGGAADNQGEAIKRIVHARQLRDFLLCCALNNTIIPEVMSDDGRNGSTFLSINTYFHLSP